MCPGLAMGIQAAQLALRAVGEHSKDEEVVAVVETDMCGVDAIQFLTGCTFGKGNLIHRDWGKNVYTFYRRSDGRAVRIAGRPDAWSRDPERQALFDQLADEKASEFRQLHAEESRRILDLPAEQLYTVRPVQGPPPHHARVFDTILCAECGEGVMETRVRRLHGRELCPPCFEAALSD